jgi:hypothetical protein
VKNPFDATEVFEFPPGTSDLEARRKAAELLLQRARARLDQGAHVRTANTRTAQN